jgi:hypothetical protein
VHFWWNLIEMSLLLGAGSLFLRSFLARRAAPSHIADRPA